MIEMVTFTRENVSGLDVSSPVRYRGVPVGQVSNLAVDTRSATIRIDFQIFKHRLTTIGADVRRVEEFTEFAALRAQVVSNPVTGEAYLLLDVPRNAPPPISLGFTPDRIYVPSAPTQLATLRDRMPEVLERLESDAADTPGHRRQASRQPGSQPTGSSPTSSVSLERASCRS